MRYNYTKRALFAWLTLMLSFTALGLSAQTLDVEEGATLTIENTLDGKFVQNTRELLCIQKGGSVTLKGTLEELIHSVNYKTPVSTHWN